jgi:hypothetical protein
MARLTDDEQKALVHNLEDIILRQGEQIKKLEAALADCDPLIMRYNTNWLECAICGAVVMEEWTHTPDCIWRQAKVGTE